MEQLLYSCLPFHGTGTQPIWQTSTSPEVEDILHENHACVAEKLKWEYLFTPDATL